MSKNVMVVGTGTIGEPLIGLLAEHKDALGLDNVLFFKRTPLSDEKGKVEALLRKGSKIVSTADALSDFKNPYDTSINAVILGDKYIKGNVYITSSNQNVILHACFKDSCGNDANKTGVTISID